MVSGSVETCPFDLLVLSLVGFLPPAYWRYCPSPQLHAYICSGLFCRETLASTMAGAYGDPDDLAFLVTALSDTLVRGRALDPDLVSPRGPLPQSGFA